MKILRVIVLQSESHKYNTVPRSIGWGEDIYDFAKISDPSFLGRDEDRLIHKFREYDIYSSVCNRLNVVLTPDCSFHSPELVDVENFKTVDKKTRFVNVSVIPSKFSVSSDEKKRKIILDAIKESLLLVVDEEFKDIIIKICDDVYILEDETECLLKTKVTKKYVAQIWYKTKATGYTAILRIKNLKTNVESQEVLFEDKHHAYFLISLHKLEIKGGKCIIYSDPQYAPEDDPIVVNMNV